MLELGPTLWVRDRDLQSLTSQNKSSALDHIRLKLPERALPLRLITVRIP
jgi:hypothetical protein